MRIIPKKTKVSTEFFRGVSLWDVLVGFFGILVMFLVFLSSLPGKLWLELVLFFVFGLLLVRIDEAPNYKFLLQLVRHFSHERRFQKMEHSAAPAGQTGKPARKERKLARRKAGAKKKGGRRKGKKKEPETIILVLHMLTKDIASVTASFCGRQSSIHCSHSNFYLNWLYQFNARN